MWHKAKPYQISWCVLDELCRQYKVGYLNDIELIIQTDSIFYRTVRKQQVCKIIVRKTVDMVCNNLLVYYSVLFGGQAVILDPKSERGNWKETLPEIAHEINIVNLTSDKDNAEARAFVTVPFTP